MLIHENNKRNFYHKLIYNICDDGNISPFIIYNIKENIYKINIIKNINKRIIFNFIYFGNHLFHGIKFS